MAVFIKYFVHGTTTDNLSKLASGWNNVDLAPKGIEQANALKETIRNEYFDVVISSDLKRAIDSSNINFEGRDIEILRDARIRECNYGDFNGKDNSFVKYEEHIENPFKNGESLKQVEKRVAEFLNFLKTNYDGKRVAIVAHRAPQLAIEVLTQNKTWEEAIGTDWRKEKNWQPGWEYEVK